jgi:hypothetical protein
MIAPNDESRELSYATSDDLKRLQNLTNGCCKDMLVKWGLALPLRDRGAGRARSRSVIALYVMNTTSVSVQGLFTVANIAKYPTTCYNVHLNVFYITNSH